MKREEEIEFCRKYDEKVDKCKRETGHEFTWHDTSIGGFAQCHLCGIVAGDDMKEEDCYDYVTPEAREKKTKEVRARDLEKRKRATIAFLKSKGLPYYE